MSKPEIGETPESKATVSKTTFVSQVEFEKLKKVLDDEKKKASEYLSRLKYLQADFENLQKRTKKEVDEAILHGNEGLIMKLLPILDDLERALNSAKETKDKEAVLDGLELILKEVQTTLYEVGLLPIESIGKSFDPLIHEAIGYVESSDQPENTITREFRKGYKLGDKVIRPSVVEVVRSPKNTTSHS
jgi:molecular chaperone GrpE